LGWCLGWCLGRRLGLDGATQTQVVSLASWARGVPEIGLAHFLLLISWLERGRKSKRDLHGVLGNLTLASVTRARSWDAGVKRGVSTTTLRSRRLRRTGNGSLGGIHGALQTQVIFGPARLAHWMHHVLTNACIATTTAVGIGLARRVHVVHLFARKANLLCSGGGPWSLSRLWCLWRCLRWWSNWLLRLLVWASKSTFQERQPPAGSVSWAIANEHKE